MLEKSLVTYIGCLILLQLSYFIVLISCPKSIQALIMLSMSRLHLMMMKLLCVPRPNCMDGKSHLELGLAEPKVWLRTITSPGAEPYAPVTPTYPHPTPPCPIVLMWLSQMGLDVHSKTRLGCGIVYWTIEHTSIDYNYLVTMTMSSDKKHQEYRIQVIMLGACPTHQFSTSLDIAKRHAFK